MTWLRNKGKGLIFGLWVGFYRYQHFLETAWFVIYNLKSIARHNNMKPAVWYWALGGILSIITVLGKGLVIYLIVSRKRFHKTVNWSLFSLAVAYLCVGLIHIPSKACVSASLCSKCITTAMRWLFLNLSMTNLSSLTVDHDITIVTPLKCPTFKTKRRHFTPFTWIYCAGMKNAVRTFLTVQASSLSVIIYSLLKDLFMARKQKKRASVQLTQLSFMSPEC